MYNVESEDELRYVRHEFLYSCPSDVNVGLGNKIFAIDDEDVISQQVCDYLGFGQNSDGRYCNVHFFYDSSEGDIEVTLVLNRSAPKLILSHDELFGISDKVFVPCLQQIIDQHGYTGFDSNARIEITFQVDTTINLSRK